MDNIKFNPIEHNKTTLEECERNAEFIAQLLEQAGLVFHEIDIPNNTAYSKVFINKKDKSVSPDTVRIYRGINDLSTALNQEPYINRFEQYDKLPSEEKEIINTSLAKLTQNPTKENLDAHVNLIIPFLNPQEKKELDDDLVFVEEGISNGYSVRKMIHQKQIAHPTGSSTFGISPYLSTTYRKDQVYAGNIVLVIDAPVGNIEDWSPNDDDETNYVGPLNRDHIVAILVDKEYDPFVYKKDPQEELVPALDYVETFLDPVSEETMRTARIRRYQELG